MSHGVRDIYVGCLKLLCILLLTLLSCTLIPIQAFAAHAGLYGTAGLARLPLISQLDTKDAVQYNGVGHEVTANTPTSSATVAWMTQVARDDVALSEPLFINGHVVIVAGSTLKVIDASSQEGSVVASLELDGSVDYQARPLFVNNTYYVAIQSGRIQAVDLSDMHQPRKRWTSADSFAAGAQTVTSLRLINLEGEKLISFGTARFDGNWQVIGGEMAAVHAETGAIAWESFHGSPVGYYRSDAPQFGKYIVRGDSSGTISVCNPQTGRVAGDIINIGAAINSDFTPLSATEAVYTSYDGRLHKLTIEQNGRLTDLSTRLFSQSISTPVIVGNRAVVTGVGSSQATQLAVVDLNTMRVQKFVSSTAEGPLPKGGSKAPALVVKQGNEVYAYFTAHTPTEFDPLTRTYAAGGNVYVYKLGDDVASLVYAPTKTNAHFSFSPVINDPEGNLYYLNNSGYLVKLIAPQTPPITPDPTPDPTPNPTPNPTPDPTPSNPTTPNPTHPQTTDVVPNTVADASKQQPTIPSILGNSEPVNVHPLIQKLQENNDASAQDAPAKESQSNSTEATGNANEGTQILFVPVSEFPIASVVGFGAAGVVALALAAWLMFIKP